MLAHALRRYDRRVLASPRRPRVDCAGAAASRILGTTATLLKEMSPMTRTPTNSVIAIAIAARAPAWDMPSGAHLTDPASGGSPLPLLH